MMDDDLEFLAVEGAEGDELRNINTNNNRKRNFHSSSSNIDYRILNNSSSKK
jgi:hypothetical protein